LQWSRREIEDRVGAAVTTLALPNGDWPQRRWRSLIAESGYTLVATSRWRGNSSVLREVDGVRVVNRHTVRRDTTLEQFAHIVEQAPGFTSVEGLRLEALAAVRRVLGVGRYSRWRQRLLGHHDTPSILTADTVSTGGRTGS
jgi:hypothetical protein